jgi:hypothetical protein
MSFLERNLRTLYRGRPALEGSRFEDRQPPPELELLDSASGHLTARLAGVYLHSRYDPVREAEAIVSREATEGTTAAIFYGFGLGYQVQAFRRRHPEVPAVVIEPDPGLFAEALRRRDLAELLGAGELFWHIGDEPEAVVMTLDSVPLGDPKVLRLRPAVDRAPEYFRKVDTAIRALLDRRNVNLNTLRRFGRLWLRNLLANLPPFAASPGVDRLRGRFEGVPALVLAAGPSLDGLLPRLRELRERLLLVAVDTSHRPCLESGTEPDLLVTVDPQYWNTRHLDRARVGSTVVVSEPSVHPGVFRRLEGEPALYFVSSFFPLGRVLEEAVGNKGTVGAGGSVATTAWDLARLLGCSPIYMGGLDLGYPGALTHCRGAFFEERSHVESGRLRPAETAQFGALHDAGPVAVESNEGGHVLTDRRLLIYKWWFENQMSQQERASGGGERTRTHCLSAGGVRIRGMAYRPLDSLLELPRIRPLVEARLAELRREAKEYLASGAERLRSALASLRELSGDLRKLRSLASRGREACARLRYGTQGNGLRPQPEGASGEVARAGRWRAGAAGQEEPRGDERPELYRRLEEVDAGILALSSRNVAGFLFQPLIQRILDSPQTGGPPERILGVSEELYCEIEESAAYHLRLLGEAIRRVRIR